MQAIRSTTSWMMIAVLAGLPACTTRIVEMKAGEATLAARFDASSHPVRREVGASDHHDVLILTSGGADGAFGAGVLQAWSESGTRPEFDVVAGASTGALQATSAFLGEDHDALLKRIYTTTRTRDIFRSNGLRSFMGSGLYDPTPMRELLMEMVTEDILDQVAAAHDTGRRLYVVTTDMTLGKSAFWDMGAIASSGGNRRSDFVNILIASVAAPGLIEPVRITEEQGKSGLHGDGGVKAPVPLESFMLPRQGGGMARVWVIANGHVSREAGVRSDSTTTLTLARRGISQLLRQLLYSSIREAETKSSRSGASFRLISLPTTIPEARNPFDFHPEEMTELFEAGCKAGAEEFGTASGKQRGASRK